MTPSACETARGMLSAHLDGELAPEFEAAVRSHLDGCAACRVELEELRLTLGALRSLPELPAPAGLLAGVRAGIAAPPRPAGFFQRLGRGWLVGVPIGALASLVVVFGIAFFQQRHPELGRQAAAPAVNAPQASIPTSIPAEPPAAAPVAAPAPAAKSEPARAKVAARTAVAGAESSKAKAQPAPAPSPAEPTVRLAEEREARTEAGAPAASHFVIPEQEAAPAARDLFGAKASADRLADERAGSPGSYREPAPRLAGSDRDAPPLRTDASRQAGASGSIRPRAEGGSFTGALAKAAAAKKDAPAREAIEVLYVLTRDGEDLEGLRRILKREGGSLLEVRALDPERQRDAVAPLRGQIPAERRISRGWMIEAKVPRRNFGRFLEAVKGGANYELIQREPAAEREGQAPEQNIRINLFR